MYFNASLFNERYFEPWYTGQYLKNCSRAGGCSASLQNRAWPRSKNCNPSFPTTLSLRSQTEAHKSSAVTLQSLLRFPNHSPSSRTLYLALSPLPLPILLLPPSPGLLNLLLPFRILRRHMLGHLFQLPQPCTDAAEGFRYQCFHLYAAERTVAMCPCDSSRVSA